MASLTARPTEHLQLIHEINIREQAAYKQRERGALLPPNSSLIYNLLI
jgi:hypothetical protein